MEGKIGQVEIPSLSDDDHGIIDAYVSQFIGMSAASVRSRSQIPSYSVVFRKLPKNVVRHARNFTCRIKFNP